MGDDPSGKRIFEKTRDNYIGIDNELHRNRFAISALIVCPILSTSFVVKALFSSTLSIQCNSSTFLAKACRATSLQRFSVCMVISSYNPLGSDKGMFTMVNLPGRFYVLTHI